MAVTEEWLSPAQAERIIRLVAHHVGAEVHRGTPRVSAELPESGQRFEGPLPPVVTAPIFSIRPPASLPPAVAAYVAAGPMTTTAAAYMAGAGKGRAHNPGPRGTPTRQTPPTTDQMAGPQTGRAAG